MDVISIPVVSFPHPHSCFLICSGWEKIPTPCQSKSNCETPSIVRSCDSLSLETSPPGTHRPSELVRRSQHTERHSKQPGGCTEGAFPKLEGSWGPPLSHSFIEAGVCSAGAMTEARTSLLRQLLSPVASEIPAAAVGPVSSVIKYSLCQTLAVGATCTSGGKQSRRLPFLPPWRRSRLLCNRQRHPLSIFILLIYRLCFIGLWFKNIRSPPSMTSVGSVLPRATTWAKEMVVL